MQQAKVCCIFFMRLEKVKVCRKAGMHKNIKTGCLKNAR